MGRYVCETLTHGRNNANRLALNCLSHVAFYHLLFNSQPYLCVLTETSDTDITTTEIIKRRDVGPYGIRSEYCIRKIICPLGVPETPKGNGDWKSLYAKQPISVLFCRHGKFSVMHGWISQKRCWNFICPPFLWAETPTPQRKGLRSSALRPKKPEPAKQTGPVVIETWVAEEDLELWEIRAFTERCEFPLFLWIYTKIQCTDSVRLGYKLCSIVLHTGLLLWGHFHNP